MEFAFGTNWAAYSRFVGDVFDSALAAEGIFAFFLESGAVVQRFSWCGGHATTLYLAMCYSHESRQVRIVPQKWQIHQERPCFRLKTDCRTASFHALDQESVLQSSAVAWYVTYLAAIRRNIV